MTRRMRVMVLAAATVAAVAGVPRSVRAQAGCPSPNINDVMKDPRVREALDQAWRDSHEGAPDEHEEGGYIEQCRSENVLTHEWTYYTQIIRWPPGTVDESAPPYDPRQSGDCRTVATFHTHPGPGSWGNSTDPTYGNDRPSNEDTRASAEDGLPGIIRYGQGDSSHDFHYGYGDMTEPRDPGWQCDRPPDWWLRAHGFGDPHLLTLDGLAYDFMAVGDFELLSTKRGDVEVQVRLQPYKNSMSAAVTSGLVVRDGRDRVEWALGTETPFLNGAPHPLEAGQRQRLLSHGILERTSNGYDLITSVGDRIEVMQSAEGLDYTITPAAHRRGTMSGLVGNGDGDPENDLAGADGKVTSPSLGSDAPDHAQPLYARFGESWRVGPAKSLFLRPYQSPAGVDPRTFPRPPAAATEAQRAAAASRCRAAGVVDPTLLDACVFDILQTGSDAFTAGAARVDKRVRESAGTAASGPIAADREYTGVLGPGAGSVSYAIDLPRNTYLFDARGSRGTVWKLAAGDDDLLAGAGDMNQYPTRLAVPGGHYRLEVSLGSEATAGRFRFRVRTTAMPVAAALAVGAEASGRIDAPGEVRAYRLQLPAGTYDFVPTTGDELSWSLASASGDELFDANQRVFMERAARLTIASPGGYTLSVSGRSWVGLGGYTIAVKPAARE